MMGKKVLKGLLKAGEALLWGVSALVLPVSLSFKGKNLGIKPGPTAKKIGAYLFAWNVLVPNIPALLFPSAGAALKAAGVNPEAAEELAPGRRVYVFDNGWKGRLALKAMHSSGWGWPLSLHKWKDPKILEGYDAQMKNTKVSGFAMTQLPGHFNICAIFVKPNNGMDERKRKWIEAGSSGRLTYVSPLNPSEVRAVTIAHESVHCDWLNMEMKSVLAQEGDADARAAEALAKHKSPDMRVKVLRHRLVYNGHAEHDTALYLDFAFNKAKAPPPEEIDAANRQAQRVVWIEKSADRSEASFDPQETQIVSCSGGGDTPMQCEMPPPLSDLARRRVQLWREHKDAIIRPK